MIPNDPAYRLLSRLRRPSLGLGLRLGLSGGATFNPLIMFANNEQGFWYDPSDLTTIFQDSAGTTPGAVGSVVGLMLDKSKGLVLGAELSGTFAVALIGTATAATYSTGTGVGTVSRAGDANNQSTVVITGLTSTSFYKVTISNTGAVSLVLRGNGPGGTVVATVNAGETFSGYVSGFVQYNIAANGNGVTASFTLTSFKHIAGNHAYQSTTASKPILRQDGTRYYLECDGTDDFMLTNSIDFSATDKMTVIAGVRKLSDAGTGIVAELSADATANNGAFALHAPNGPNPNYLFRSRGTTSTQATATTSYAAPITSVLTGQSNIATPLCAISVNGAVIESGSGPQGTGNYGNYPLYLFRRGGSSVPFNGRFYGAIVRGAATDAGTLNRAEFYMNSRTGAY